MSKTPEKCLKIEHDGSEAEFCPTDLKKDGRMPDEAKEKNWKELFRIIKEKFDLKSSSTFILLNKENIVDQINEDGELVDFWNALIKNRQLQCKVLNLRCLVIEKNNKRMTWCPKNSNDATFHSDIEKQNWEKHFEDLQEFVGISGDGNEYLQVNEQGKLNSKDLKIIWAGRYEEGKSSWLKLTVVKENDDSKQKDAEMEELKKTNNDLTNQNATKDATITEMKNQIGQKDAEMEELKKTNADLTNQLEVKETEKQDLIKEYDTKRNEMERAEAQRATLLKKGTFTLPLDRDVVKKPPKKVFEGHSDVKNKLDRTQQTMDNWTKSKGFEWTDMKTNETNSCSKENRDCCVMKFMELSFQPWKDNQQIKLSSIPDIFKILAEQDAFLQEKLRTLADDMKTKEERCSTITEEYERQAAERKDAYEQLKEAFTRCEEAIKKQNELRQQQADNSAQLEDVKRENTAFDTLHAHCVQLLHSYQKYQDEMKKRIQTLDDTLEEKWHTFETTWTKWNEHGVVVFVQKKMNWWECGNIVTPQTINNLHEKFKANKVKGSTLSSVTKLDLMEKFDIRTYGDVTKIFDAIQQLQQKPLQMIPSQYLCPICHKPMTDPVVALDTRNYCRVCIEGWAEEHKDTPEGRRLYSQGVLHLCSSLVLQQEITNFLASHPQCNYDNQSSEIESTRGETRGEIRQERQERS